MARNIETGRGVAPVFTAVLLAVVGSTSALAETATPSDLGIMKFEHVSVVNAMQAPATPAADAARETGMRAYKDVGGSLRGGSQEEADALSVAPRHVTSRGRLAREAAEPFAAAIGGWGMKLDETSDAYSMAVRQPDGTIGEVCVAGEDNAQKVLATQPLIRRAHVEEASHVR